MRIVRNRIRDYQQEYWVFARSLSVQGTGILINTAAFCLSHNRLSPETRTRYYMRYLALGMLAVTLLSKELGKAEIIICNALFSFRHTITV